MKFYFIVILAILYVGISSCEKREINTVAPIEGLFKDMEVDDLFDWKLSRDVQFNIPNALNRVIRITSTSGNLEYFIGFSTVDNFSTVITIPTYVSDVSINGIQVSISGDVVDLEYSKSAQLISSTSFGSESLFNDAATDHIDVDFFNSTSFVVVFQDKGNGNKGTAVVGVISGNSVTYGSELVFNSDNTESISVSALNTNTFVVAYSDVNDSGKGKAIVGTISGDDVLSFSGSEVDFHLSNTDNINVKKVSSSTFVVAYRTSFGSEEGNASLGRVTGTSISFGPESNFTNPQNSLPWTYTVTGTNHNILIQNTIAITINGEQISEGSYIGVFYDSLGTLACAGYTQYLPSGNMYMTAWGVDAGNDGFVSGEELKWKVWDVLSDNQIDMTATYQTFGFPNSNQFAVNGLSSLSSLVDVSFNGACDYLSLDVLDASNFVIAFKDVFSNGYGNAIHGSISGNTLSFDSKYVFNSANTENISVSGLDGNTFVIAYKDGGDSNNGNILVGSESGGAISFGSEQNFNSASDWIATTKVSSTSIVIAYRDINNSNYGTAIDATILGNSITFGSEQVFNSANGDNLKMNSNGTQVVISYKDIGNGEKGTAVISNLFSDSDGDGISDDVDDYPNDPTRAFDSYYPASNVYGTVGFEDLWPSQGDYDFNDLVVGFQFKTVLNASNEVVEIFTTWVVRATGAGFSNGFGFNLPNATVNSSDITVSGYSSTAGLITYNSNGTEANQSLITIIPYDEVPNIGNTKIGVAFIDYDTTVVYISVDAGTYYASDFDLAAFNPFLIINQIRGKEVHLPSPGYNPTSLADVSLFGTKDDASVPSLGKYYKTSNNLPWAIKIPAEFDYPIEKVDIGLTYLHLADWALSNGTQYNDWYMDYPNYRNSANIYVRP